VIIVLDADQAEADLAAGRLACPGCGGQLRPWAWARPRTIRLRGGTSRPLRPRRARCQSCHTSHVLLASWCQPRLADATEVVGAALVAKAAGRGYRRIAAELDRPPSTVRRWLRRARDPGHVERLRRRGVQRAAEFDQEVINGLRVQPTALGDALEALAAAAVAWRRLFRRAGDGWALVGMFTGGRLLAAPPFR
jgi:transposase-like protein